MDTLTLAEPERTTPGSKGERPETTSKKKYNKKSEKLNLNASASPLPLKNLLLTVCLYGFPLL